MALKEEQRFGLLLSLASLFIFSVSYLKGHHRYWLLPIGFFIFFLTFVFPSVLKPFNWVWHKLGLLLHYITSPILMILTYYVAFLPIGLILRLSGKDLLKKKTSNVNSYWIFREPPGPSAESLNRQF